VTNAEAFSEMLSPTVTSTTIVPTIGEVKLSALLDYDWCGENPTSTTFTITPPSISPTSCLTVDYDSNTDTYAFTPPSLSGCSADISVWETWVEPQSAYDSTKF